MYDCIVIGAGQAGLAAGYALAERGLDYLLLEAHRRVGDQWRARWKGLRLFTPNRYNALPGSPFPGAPYALPDRLAVADYLEGYARAHALRVRTDSPVLIVERDLPADHWRVDTGSDVLRARHVVIAAGAYRTPRLPDVAQRLPAQLPHLHAADLRDPATWLPSGGRHVLVVGAGASGFQLARLLSARHRVTLAGPDPGRLPRRVLGRDVYDLLYGLGVLRARVDGPAGRLLAKPARKGEIRVGDAVDVVAAELGIRRTGKIVDYAAGAFATDSGERLGDVDAVLFATGYRNAYPFLPLPEAFDADGRPRHRAGHSPLPGLHWLGLPQLRRVGSSLLGAVGEDAGELIGEIA